MEIVSERAVQKRPGVPHFLRVVFMLRVYILFLQNEKVI